MTEMFSTLGSWNWLIFGVILMALELLAPGVFLFWLGLAALLVGLLSFAFHPSWQIQILMFAIFAAAAVPLWRRIARNNAAFSASNPFLNRRADALVGRVFTLEKPIVDGTGTVRIDDTVWRVAGPDAPAGSRVRIVQADGPSSDCGPGLAQRLVPALGEVMQWQECLQQFPTHGSEPISLSGYELDEFSLPQIGQARLKHRRRGLVAGGAQGA